ncbi:hypothetical protein BCV70DRAFT_218783 [Testicularia cyperi]|uniref:Uncharacterized protein n=1 Tax=Testicularia cyperi TaxID=1882483 RepID=A0A317XJ37_9BASI|nr:hypothetical protein BCV70DRAFT_218783 [Testicularia cyperi]
MYAKSSTLQVLFAAVFVAMVPLAVSGKTVTLTGKNDSGNPYQLTCTFPDTDAGNKQTSGFQAFMGTFSGLWTANDSSQLNWTANPQPAVTQTMIQREFTDQCAPVYKGKLGGTH